MIATLRMAGVWHRRARLVERTDSIAPMLDRLYVLAFDHRTSLISSLLGAGGEPTADDIGRAFTAKTLIWDAFREALHEGVGREQAAVLIDATYGDHVIRAARREGIAVAVPVEESGTVEFAFEHSEWRDRLDELDPTWAKALIRYNPDGDRATNARQRQKLQELAHHCRATGRDLMLELLVPPEPEQLEALAGDRARYDREARPGLMLRAIQDLDRAEVRPNVWKIEGLDRPSDAQWVAAEAAGEGTRCIVLGRGEDRDTVDAWLRAAAVSEGFFGFAIGRSIWWEPVRSFFDAGETDAARGTAVVAIASEYRRCIAVYETAASASP
jgi:myo-inositol catabolism protein IolC